jgi:GMP synthase-like glutamine amidotransferase
MTMLIGILETGRPHEALKEHGSYPQMFERLLGAEAKEFQFRSFAAIDGEVPDDPRVCDAWLVTGSRHGAYERLPWMLRTEELLRKAVAAKVPVIGICFGHQLLAQALGGKVEKSVKGWGFGLHDYDVTEPPAIAGAGPTKITVSAVHQDQVVDVPEGGRVLGGSDFCPNAIIAYGDTALTFQGHPELSVPWMRDAAIHRMKGIAPEAVLAQAEQSFRDKSSDSVLIAKWIVQFLRDNAKSRQLAAE